MSRKRMVLATVVLALMALGAVGAYLSSAAHAQNPIAPASAIPPACLARSDDLSPTVHLPLVTSNYSQRVYSTNLAYRGAFAYPPGDDWAYSGHALAYFPEGDPGSTDGYPGSLYAAAHTWYDLVGEITIPEPVISGDFGDLPQASVLQSLADITGGWKDNCTYHEECLYREVDGLAYLPNVDKVAWNLNDWYNRDPRSMPSPPGRTALLPPPGRTWTLWLYCTIRKSMHVWTTRKRVTFQIIGPGIAGGAGPGCRPQTQVAS